MPSANFELIRQAIQEKKQVIAEYNGYVREMCPHVVGWKGDRENALLYQFGGGSSSGLEPDGSPNNWRCVHIERLSNLQLREGDWHTAPNHSRPQRCVDDIAAEVEY